MTAASPEPDSASADLHTLLDRFGLHTDGLLHIAAVARRMPTFPEYIRHLESVVPAETLRTYRPYWRRVVQAWPEHRLDTPTPRDLDTLVGDSRRNAETRRNARAGRAAADHMIDALRCLYRTAVHEGLLTPHTNPATGLHRDTRRTEPHLILTPDQVAAINHTAATTGDDPHLDALILRLHLETACHRTTALALRPTDLDTRQCLIRLTHHRTRYWQPISPGLTTALITHHRDRSPEDHSTLLRYRTGRPITHRRYDHLWNRLGRYQPWIATGHITTRHLRYTTLAWIEHHFGPALAQHFTGPETGTHLCTAHPPEYTIQEIATVVATLTAESHPLALPTMPAG